MNKIRLAGGPFLSLVLLGGKEVGPAQQIEIGLRVIGSNFLHDVFDPDHHCIEV